MASRTVREGQQRQGVDEAIAYEVDCANWCSAPQNPQVKVFLVGEDGGAYADMTASVMPSGTVEFSGTKARLPLLRDLQDRAVYRVELKFECNGSLLEAYFTVKAER